MCQPNILIGDSASTCATCGRCGAYLVLEGDGSAYPYDFFVLDEWRMGCVAEISVAALAASQKSRGFPSLGREKTGRVLRLPLRCDLQRRM